MANNVFQLNRKILRVGCWQLSQFRDDAYDLGRLINGELKLIYVLSRRDLGDLFYLMILAHKIFSSE